VAYTIGSLFSSAAEAVPTAFQARTATPIASGKPRGDPLPCLVSGCETMSAKAPGRQQASAT
jgi:hypothetical protein